MNEIAHTPPSYFDRAKDLLSTPWTITILAPLAVAYFDIENFVPVVKFAITAFLSTLVYITFAVLLISGLKASRAENMIAQIFKGRENKMIVMGALFGGLAPFCSCEVIPFIAGLLALGAPLSGVMAFWLSSPLIDPPTLFITAGALGWSFAIAKAVAAVGLGLFGGFVIKYSLQLGTFSQPLRKDFSNTCGCGPNPGDEKPVWKLWQHKQRREIFYAQFLANALFLIKWMAFAYVLEALLVTYVPATLIANLVGGPGVTPIITAAFVGMPAYLNSYVAPPLLAGLINQGMSNGAALAFMVAGAVSSIPAMAAVWSLVKPQVFATYLSLGIFGAVVSGVVFSLLG